MEDTVHSIICPSERSLPALKFRYLREGLEGTRGRVLEIGCGDGKHIRSVEAESGTLELYGCDIDFHSLAAARKASKKVVFVSGDAARLPFMAESFDAVIFSSVIEHVPDYRKAIEEIWRVLKKGGGLVCYIPLEGEWYSLFRIYRALLDSSIMRLMGHVHMFRREDVMVSLAPYFNDFSINYSYHLFGQICNFIYFYMLYYGRKDYEFFRQKYSGYRSGRYPERNFAGAVIRKLVLLSNRIAYFESLLLSRLRFPAIGMHIWCRRKDSFL